MILLVVFLGFQLVSSQGDKVFKCAESKEQTIEVKCPPGKVIRINEAIYGVNQYNLCLYTKGDCIEYVDLDNECCGHNFCNVTYWKVYSVKCHGGSFVSFFRLIYDCVPPQFSECEVKVTLTVPKPKPITTSSKETTTILLSRATKDTVGSPVTVVSVPEEQNSEDLAIILGSAIIVALLLASIITVLFLLKKFPWQSEKQCFLQMFVGLCTRHPPDGCENPDDDDANRGSRDSVIVVVNSTKTDHSRDRNDNDSNKDLQMKLQTTVNDDESNQNKENSNNNLTSEQRRKRKRDQSLPEITMRLFDSALQNSPKISNHMRQYNRNITISHDKQSDVKGNDNGQEKRIPMDITNIAENKNNFVIREGPGTTSV